MFRYNHPNYYTQHPTLNKIHTTEQQYEEPEEDEGGEEEDKQSFEYTANNNLQELTLNLMVNHKYLAKTNPIRMNQRREWQEKIVRNRKEIIKLINECFRHLEEGDSDPLGKMHLMDEFEHFAKLALEEIENSKMPESDQLFSKT